MALEDLTNVDMKVYPTHDCGSECPFCMTDLRWKNSEISTEAYLENFKRAFGAYYKAGGRKVLFTGGEPTRRPDKLIGMLREIRHVPLDLVVLYTNGLTLLDDFEGERLIERLASEGLQDINISLHHYDPKRRQELSKQGVCNIDTISEIAKQKDIRIRLNCTLLRDYIGNADEVLNYLNFAQRMGISDVYFRDLFHLENRERSCAFANKQKLAYTDEQRIDFQKLLVTIRKDGRFHETEQLNRHRDHGQTYIFNYKGMRVSFGTLMIGTESNKEITYFNFQPDGNIYRDMNGPDSKIEL
jgi:molybdenum cofactor biosynthesis enzyme MoaA